MVILYESVSFFWIEFVHCNIIMYIRGNITYRRKSKGPSAIIFQEWTDTRTFSYLKYTLIYNYV